MRFVLEELPRRVGFIPWPDVVSGTSVGALNGVFAAARERAGIETLTRIWRGMKVGDVYRVAPLQALGQLLRWREGERFALLDPEPFHQLVARRFPALSLRRALDSGLTRAFIVSATEIATGFNTLFVDGSVEVRPQPGARVAATQISSDHCRASAAIPFIFPPVKVDGRYYVDGGLRQNTPLRPAIQAGVTRALVIGVKQDREEEAAATRVGQPSLVFLAGKMLNALLLDPIERDLVSTEHRNKILAWGVSRYGPEFAVEAADHGLRRIDISYIRPSEDLGRIANAIYHAHARRLGRGVRLVLDRLHAYAHDAESDVLSYLYFDEAYTATIEALGYEDAERHEEELTRLVTAAREEVRPA